MIEASPFADMPTLDGTFSTNSEDILSAGQDFGKLVLTRPVGVLKPKSIQDISGIVEYAAKNQLKIIPRGMSHSAFGQCQCDGGIVIDMSSFNHIMEKRYSHVSSWALVEAGCTWYKLINRTIPEKFAPPTTTNWHELSIGGTLSSGGLGFMSYRKGLQADNVLELEVVTGTGKIRKCSLMKRHELFHAVRGGMGQFGVIAHAKVKLEPAPSRTQVFQFFHTDSKAYFEDLQQLVQQEHFECIHSYVLPNKAKAIEAHIGAHLFSEYEEQIAALNAQDQDWIYFTELAKYAKSPTSSEIRLRKLQYFNHFFLPSLEQYSDYTRKTPLLQNQVYSSDLARPALGLVMPAHSMARFMDDVLANLKLEEGTSILLIPLKRGRIHTPLFQTPEADSLFFVGMLRGASSDASLVELQQKEHFSFYQKAINFGGKRYLSDSISEPNTPAGWAKHFGEIKWQKMQEVKYEYDPNGVFASNLKMF